MLREGVRSLVACRAGASSICKNGFGSRPSAALAPKRINQPSSHPAIGPQVLDKLKNSVDARVGALHSAVVLSNALVHAGGLGVWGAVGAPAVLVRGTCPAGTQGTVSLSASGATLTPLVAFLTCEPQAPAWTPSCARTCTGCRAPPTGPSSAPPPAWASSTGASCSRVRERTQGACRHCVQPLAAAAAVQP